MKLNSIKIGSKRLFITAKMKLLSNFIWECKKEPTKNKLIHFYDLLKDSVFKTFQIRKIFQLRHGDLNFFNKDCDI